MAPYGGPEASLLELARWRGTVNVYRSERVSFPYFKKLRYYAAGTFWYDLVYPYIYLGVNVSSV